MRRNPLYSFRDITSVGIYDVPMNSTIHILDAGAGIPKFVEIIAKTGLSVGSTIGQFLANPNLYMDLSGGGTIPSELEKITEVEQGWRILGRNPNNFGDIGEGAIDFSDNPALSTTAGATGYKAFAAGENTKASGRHSTAFGIGTTADNDGSLAIGRYNTTMGTPGSTIADNIFTVGIGLGASNLRDGLVVTTSGIILAPTSDIQSLEDADSKALITKEFVDGRHIFVSEKAQPLGVATLDIDSKIPAEQIPVIAISETYVVDNQAEQLALRVEIGDVCVRTDLSQTFIQNGGSTQTMSDWTLMATPAQAISSVNGQVGTVNLGISELYDVNTGNLVSDDLLQWNGVEWQTISGSSLGVDEFILLIDTPNLYPDATQDGYILKATSAGVIFEDVIDGGSYSGTTSVMRAPRTFLAEAPRASSNYISSHRSSRI